MKIKPFIFRTPYLIQGLKAVRSEVNRYGVMEQFYYIDNNNLETLLTERYDKDFSSRNLDDVTWFLNSCNVSIVSNSYLFNQFIIKDYYSVMKCSSIVSVVI
jgi:hypothetical protein